MADWDVAIIGGGAAGLSAAAAAAGSGLSCLVIDRMGGGGELMNLGTLHDMDESLTGPDLFARLMEQATEAGAELGIAEVTGLTQAQTGWRIATDDESHTARAVILATGLAPGTLGLHNEAAFEGQGLSHCAACDGPLYAGQPVVVAGAGRWAIAEARELAQIASEVTLVAQGAPGPAAETFTILPGRIAALEGASGLESVLVQTAGATPQRLPAHAIFVQTGRRPALGFAPEAMARDADGRPITDWAHQTNLPGLFAVGPHETLTEAIANGRRAAALGKGAA